MAKLTLKDVARYTETMNREELMNNPDMLAYVSEMQEVGTEVLKNLSSEEIAAAVSFMESMFCIQMMRDNPMMGLVLVSKMEDLVIAMAQTLKVAIGIMLSEEWR